MAKSYQYTLEGLDMFTICNSQLFSSSLVRLANARLAISSRLPNLYEYGLSTLNTATSCNLCLLLAFIITLCTSAGAQQPQTQTATSSTNAQWANGVAPGYWPTGTTLTLNLSSGTAICFGNEVDYAGGTLTMVASTTNYVYLNTGSNCVPAVKSAAFVAGDLPIARVVTGASSITHIYDDRTLLSNSATTANTLGQLNAGLYNALFYNCIGQAGSCIGGSTGGDALDSALADCWNNFPYITLNNSYANMNFAIPCHVKARPTYQLFQDFLVDNSRGGPESPNDINLSSYMKYYTATIESEPQNATQLTLLNPGMYPFAGPVIPNYARIDSVINQAPATSVIYTQPPMIPTGGTLAGAGYFSSTVYEGGGNDGHSQGTGYSLANNVQQNVLNINLAKYVHTQAAGAIEVSVTSPAGGDVGILNEAGDCGGITAGFDQGCYFLWGSHAANPNLFSITNVAEAIPSLLITNVAILGGTATLSTPSTSLLTVGKTVMFTQLQAATCLNLTTPNIASVGTGTFTVTTSCANYTSAADLGLVEVCPGVCSSGLWNYSNQGQQTTIGWAYANVQNGSNRSDLRWLIDNTAPLNKGNNAGQIQKIVEGDTTYPISGYLFKITCQSDCGWGTKFGGGNTVTTTTAVMPDGVNGAPPPYTGTFSIGSGPSYFCQTGTPTQSSFPAPPTIGTGVAGFAVATAKSYPVQKVCIQVASSSGFNVGDDVAITSVDCSPEISKVWGKPDGTHLVVSSQCARTSGNTIVYKGPGVGLTINFPADDWADGTQFWYPIVAADSSGDLWAWDAMFKTGAAYMGGRAFTDMTSDTAATPVSTPTVSGAGLGPYSVTAASVATAGLYTTTNLVATTPGVAAHYANPITISVAGTGLSCSSYPSAHYALTWSGSSYSATSVVIDTPGSCTVTSGTPTFTVANAFSDPPNPYQIAPGTSVRRVALNKSEQSGNNPTTGNLATSVMLGSQIYTDPNPYIDGTYNASVYTGGNAAAFASGATAVLSSWYRQYITGSSQWGTGQETPDAANRGMWNFGTFGFGPLYDISIGTEGTPWYEYAVLPPALQQQAYTAANAAGAGLGTNFQGFGTLPPTRAGIFMIAPIFDAMYGINPPVDAVVAIDCYNGGLNAADTSPCNENVNSPWWAFRYNANSRTATGANYYGYQIDIASSKMRLYSGNTDVMDLTATGAIVNGNLTVSSCTGCTSTAPGSNTDVLINSSGAIGATSALTVSGTTITATGTNNLNITGSGNTSIGNSSSTTNINGTIYINQNGSNNTAINTGSNTGYILLGNASSPLIASPWYTNWNGSITFGQTAATGLTLASNAYLQLAAAATASSGHPYYGGVPSYFLASVYGTSACSPQLSEYFLPTSATAWDFQFVAPLKTNCSASGIASAVVTFDTASFADGTYVAHLLSKADQTAVTIAAGSGAGTSPTLSVTRATDLKGTINLITGSSPAASSVIATITFGTPYQSGPVCTVTPASATAAGTFFSPSAGTNSFTINALATALTASTTYTYSYICAN